MLSWCSMHISAVEKKRNVVIIILPLVTACLLALMGMLLVWIWRKHKLRGRTIVTSLLESQW
jgi:ABC-type sulfate transport system permease subunit